jgi:hypothetical protein
VRLAISGERKMSQILSERVEVDATHPGVYIFELKCDLCGGSGEVRAANQWIAKDMRSGKIPSPFACRECRGEVERKKIGDEYRNLGQSGIQGNS